MSQDERWLRLREAAQLVKCTIGCSSLGPTRPILCMAGDDPGQIVRTRGAEGVREWAAIDLENEALQDGFGERRYADVQFNNSDLRAWLARNREWLRQEYGAAPQPSGTAPGDAKRASGSKYTLQAAAREYIAATYPNGVPAGKTDKMIAAEYSTTTGASMSERTVRRARTGKG